MEIVEADTPMCIGKAEVLDVATLDVLARPKPFAVNRPAIAKAVD
jgi:hypothetical protein